MVGTGSDDPGVGLFWIGELSGEFFSQYLSLWLIVGRAVLAPLGREKLKAMLPSLMFSPDHVPSAGRGLRKISFNLKLISSIIGVKMMQLWGLSVYREAM